MGHVLRALPSYDQCMREHEQEQPVEVRFLIGSGSIEEFLTRREVEEIEQTAWAARFDEDVEA